VHTYFCSSKFLLEIVFVWFISVIRARGVLEVPRFRTTTFSMRKFALVCFIRCFVHVERQLQDRRAALIQLAISNGVIIPNTRPK
jgi:hypothetical protein